MAKKPHNNIGYVLNKGKIRTYQELSCQAEPTRESLT